MYLPKTTKYLSAAVAILTFIGIALHDTKIDSMTSFAIALPIAAAVSFESAQLFLAHDAHTHVERVSVDNVAGRYISQLPKHRGEDDDKKYRLNRGPNKSGHPFEGYILPIA